VSAPSQITIARATRPSPDAYVQHVRVHRHFGLRAAARMSRRWSVRDGSAQGRSHRSRARRRAGRERSISRHLDRPLEWAE
jgi:hypothetical protein